jgi:hypothetical protein
MQSYSSLDKAEIGRLAAYKFRIEYLFGSAFPVLTCNYTSAKLYNLQFITLNSIRSKELQKFRGRGKAVL